MKVNEKEIKEFFQRASDAKKSGESLTKIFDEFAKKTGRAQGSVRNFYYTSLKKAEKDFAFKERYLKNVDLSTSKIIMFDKAEAKILLEKILIGQTFGKSVRRVIAETTQNSQVALRYQNKYRNLLKYDKQTVLQVVEEIERRYGKCYNPYQRPKHSDTQINLLKREINLLCDKIAVRLKQENQNLKRELDESQRENQLLKRLIEENLSLKENFDKTTAI